MTGRATAACQRAVPDGGNGQDRYGFRVLTVGKPERLRRDLATGPGLTTEDSALRISLASHPEAVNAELRERGHGTTTGG